MKHRGGVLFFVICVLVFSISTSWAAPRCSALKATWYDRYIKDFGISWDTKTFDCPGDEGTLALALYDLETAELTPNDSGKKPEFYSMVKNGVHEIKYDKKCKYLAYTSENTITLCDPFFTDTREDRASTLVHESRHTEADDPRHVDCVGGKYHGSTRACDEEFFDGEWKGSGFNADIYYLSWNLKFATKNNELSKSVIQSDINAMVPDRFNNIDPELIKKWRGN